MSAIPKRYEISGTSKATRDEFCCIIREADEQEIKAGGRKVWRDLRPSLEALANSHHHEVLLALRSVRTGHLLAIGGVVPFADSCGAPWFLCTIHAEEEPKALLEGIHEMSDQWAERFLYQEHRTWVGNTMHQKLIKRLGYTIHPEVDPKGFARFTKGEKPCATP